MTATLTEFMDLVLALRKKGVSLDKAEAAARRQLGGIVSAGDAPVVDEDALEKVIEAEGDKLMLAHGFQVVRFSQPRATKQTPGIPDRRYYRSPRAPMQGGPWGNAGKRDEALVCWWEAKSATGKQRPDQRDFQVMVEACGETYLLGTHEVLYAWLVEHHIAK